MPNEAREEQQPPTGHERQCVPFEFRSWGPLRYRITRARAQNLPWPIYHQSHCIQWGPSGPVRRNGPLRRVYVMCPSRVGVGVRDAGQRERARARRSDSAELLGCECVEEISSRPRCTPVGTREHNKGFSAGVASRPSSCRSTAVPVHPGTTAGMIRAKLVRGGARRGECTWECTRT